VGSSGQRSGLWSVAQNVLGIVVVLGFGGYLWHNRMAFEAVLEVSGSTIAGIALGILLTWIVASTQSYLMYRAEGVEIGWWENLFVALAGVLVNYLPMRLGTVVRMRYVKAVYGFGYARSMGILGIRLVLLVTATGMLGLVGTVWVWLGGGSLSLELMAIFAGLLVLAAAASFRSPPQVESEHRRYKIWNDFSAGFAAMRERPVVTVQVLCLIMIQLALVAWRFSLSLEAVGSSAPISLLVILSPATTLSNFVSIVPGGLGYREAIMGYVTMATGFEFNSGLFAGTVDRAVLMAMVFVMGSASFFHIWSKLPGETVQELPPSERGSS
jgi:hypothetical protein